MVFVYVPNLVWSLRPSSQSYLDILELKKSVVSSEYHFTCPGVDLALLTMANHSILSHGTFGMWGALMAGGETVMPLSHIETKEYQEIDKAQVPGWIFIWCLNWFLWLAIKVWFNWFSHLNCKLWSLVEVKLCREF